jgi:thiol:disulfide interchange protein DsbC
MKMADALPLALALALGMPHGNGAEKDSLLSTLRRTYPNTSFDAVRSSEIPGLYEVWMGSNVAYVSAAMPRYFLFGHLYDANAGKDLTVARRAAPAATPAPPSTIDAARLPLGDAIKSTHGSGARRLVVFSDPACPSCRRLDAELARLPDTTVYHFMVPFLGMELPQAVWCAPDRQQAWKAAMRGQLQAGAAAPCANPIARNRTLAERLGIAGTPTIIFPSGERIEGFVPADEIAVHLKAPRSTATGTQKE